MNPTLVPLHLSGEPSYNTLESPLLPMSYALLDDHASLLPVTFHPPTQPPVHPQRDRPGRKSSRNFFRFRSSGRFAKRASTLPSFGERVVSAKRREVKQRDKYKDGGNMVT